MSAYNYPSSTRTDGPPADVYVGMPNAAYIPDTYGDMGIPDPIPKPPPHGITTPVLNSLLLSPTVPQHGSSRPLNGHQSQQFAIDVMASQLPHDSPIPPPHRQSNLGSAPNLHGARLAPNFGANSPGSPLTASPAQLTRSPKTPLPGSEKSPEIRHVGPAPRRQVRRYKTTKRVELVQGNLVLDCQVPSKLLSSVERQKDKEFTHMRYTAATCDPNDFKANSYTLRQALMGRPTELFIVVTMYNVSAIRS